MRILLIATGLIGLVSILQGADKTIWQGQSGDLNIHWTETDITAIQDGEVLFSGAALAKQDFEADFLVDQTEDNSCKYQRSFLLLSVIGHLASLKDTEYVNCQGMPHPAIETRFMAIDLAQAGRRVKLTDFFVESDILQALLADSLVKQVLAKNPSKKSPTTLQALFEVLEWSEITVKECGYHLTEDFLNQFAFHHVKKDQVAVRLNLPPVAHACHSTDIQLGFYLPMPETLKTAFTQAQANRSGFLMKGSKKIAEGQSTDIAFSTTTDSHTASSQTITVQPGDTLYSIAKQSGYSIEEVAKWNDLSPPYHLQAGQVLQILKSSELTSTQLDTKDSETQVDKPVKHRIIKVSGVHVRAKPTRQAKIIKKLSIGTIVKQLAHSKTQTQIGQSKDYWYQIETPTGEIGWIFGGLSMVFEPKQRADIYQQIAELRLQKPLTWQDQIDLTDFLAQAQAEVQTPPESGAKLVLSHLLSLQKSLDQLNQKPPKSPTFHDWLEQQKRQDLINYDEIQGQWLMNVHRFWKLHDQYYPLSITDRIAWIGAKMPMGGECEGSLECYLRWMDISTIRYLKYHPKGKYVTQSLDKVAELINFFLEKRDSLLIEGHPELSRLLAVFKATLDRIHSSPTAATIIDKIKELEQYIPVPTHLPGNAKQTH